MSSTLLKCPNCKKSATAESKPFCSPRCKDVDLHRWFTNGYNIPGDDFSALSELNEEEIDEILQ